MAQALIIVESPAKARTIARFLGAGYVVESSIGHIRDLPTKTAEIPAAQRKKSWARLGVDVEGDFKPIYVVAGEKKAQVKKLKALLKEADALYLATDEDREGEAIAWHLVEVLNPKVPVKRMVFHEITERAIKEALATPREIDGRLVAAQEARRILDRLYGYEISPVLWRKVRPRLSAGRVQSVATRLIVERERARRAFHSAGFWSLSGTVTPVAEGSSFGAELQELGGRRVAVGRHFDPATGQLSAAARRDGVVHLDEALTADLQRDLTGATLDVADVQRKPFTQRPYPPFITSTLQQEAGRKLGFAAKRTMRAAQRLYESGYITYMRTDSTTLSQQALTATRSAVTQLYGEQYLPETPRLYAKKVKGAQEAHEAIRPAGDNFRSPDQLRNELDPEAWKLYDLIWKRTMASQMKDAKGERTQIKLRVDVAASTLSSAEGTSGPALFSASGKVINFAGYLRAYVRGTDDPEADLDDKERYLPALSVGDKVQADALEARQHNTQPPARYTEASLVKMLEEKGIGRPSTYATIIQTIQDRGYVWKQGNALVPTLTAAAVINLLEQHFGELVDYEFTARMESELDAISDGEKESTPWLERFYFGEVGRDHHENGSYENGENVQLRKSGLKGLIGSGVEHIDARDICSFDLGELEDGQVVAARVGRYGPYLQVGDTDRRANIADDVLLDELDVAQASALLHQADLANRELGADPATGKTVYLKSGSYGPYVQLGDPELTPKGNIKKGGKPKMASVWPTMDVEHLTLEDALTLLSYPRELGLHPETKAPITAQDGRFGPYIQMEHEEKRDTRSLENHEQLASIDLTAALALFAQPRKSRRRAQGGAKARELGPSPVTGLEITVRDGRFGPYVTDGQVNATIPNNRDPEKVELELALELIAAREQRMREQGKDPRAPKKARGAAKKTATKKTATKKTAAKKKAAKKTATKKKATKKKATKKKATKKKATKKKA